MLHTSFVATNLFSAINENIGRTYATSREKRGQERTGVTWNGTGYGLRACPRTNNGMVLYPHVETRGRRKGPPRVIELVVAHPLSTIVKTFPHPPTTQANLLVLAAQDSEQHTSRVSTARLLFLLRSCDGHECFTLKQHGTRATILFDFEHQTLRTTKVEISPEARIITQHHKHIDTGFPNKTHIKYILIVPLPRKTHAGSGNSAASFQLPSTTGAQP